MTSTGFRDLADKLPISVDLVKAARNLVLLLHEVHRCPRLFDDAFVEYSIHCYETMWLPFAAKHGTKVAAPLHIEWVWLVHMLSPQNYSQDCMNIVGVEVDHAAMSPAGRRKKLKKTRGLWEKGVDGKMGSWSALDTWVSSGDIGLLPTKLSYDIKSAVGRQKAFIHQVLLPHYKDARFLKSAVCNYKRLLYLKKKHPEEFVVPGYDADLVWHAHMLHPLKYRKHTERILGTLFSHDDSVNDRSPEGKLDRHHNATVGLWLGMYNENQLVAGGVYRGDPQEVPDIVCSARPLPINWKYEAEVENIALENGILDGASRHLLVKVEKGWERVQVGQTLLLEEGEVFEFRVQASSTDRQMLRFCSTGIAQTHTSSSICWRNPLTGNQKSVESIFGAVLFQDDSQEDSGNYVNVKCQLRQRYSWGLLHVPYSISVAASMFNIDNTDRNKQTACFRLANETGKQCLLCTIEHGQHPTRSSIRICTLENELLATSELMSSNDLPSSKQVKNCKHAPTLDFNDDLAMLIRGKEGDWGILKGEWLGFREGVPGVPGIPRNPETGRRGKRGIPGVPSHIGSLKAGFFPLSGCTLEGKVDGCVEFLQEGLCMSIPGVDVDLKEGTIALYEKTAAAELVALGMSLAVVHVLLQPRVMSSPLSSPSLKPLEEIDADNSLLLLAAGYCATATDGPLSARYTPVRELCCGCGGCGGCEGDFTDTSSFLDLGTVLDGGGGIADTGWFEAGGGGGAGCGGGW